ncbi:MULTISPECIES: hypothetical protein [unclassified Nitratiruptor]|uniref:hypothetical protein n=1 Tax=unclassified Nitratiruptor TaxID=2624044 RepID=UPI0019169022|nr:MULTISPECIES: hypothetical protein [unclassified Nitratiruptor]
MRIRFKAVVVHNGKEYHGGNTADLDTKSAKRLIELGVAEQAKATKVRNELKNANKE